MKYNQTEVRLKVTKYAKPQNLCIQMICKDLEYGGEEPFATMTVNLPLPCTIFMKDEKFAYVDVNNLPGIARFIEEYSLGRYTGYYKTSGFVDYPLYEFDLEQLAKYADYMED